MPPESTTPGGGRYSQIGKYRILSHLATGGMGAVYRALDTEKGREVALKILPPDLAAKPALLERFRREARSGKRLRHPNIVTLHDFGEAGGTWFLTMELVQGIDLDEYVRRNGPLDPTVGRFLLIQCTRALRHAHRRRIVHRDIKPSNILIIQRKSGRLRAKLIDLGLALQAADDEFKVTRDGTTVGTIDYIAPEQARNSRAADCRSDMYSLGCTFFHALTGSPPFPDGSLTERLYKHMEAEPPDVRQHNPKVSARLAAILARMMAKKPEDRFQTPRELLRELRRKEKPPAVPEPPPPAPPPVAPAPDVGEAPTVVIRRPASPTDVPQPGPRRKTPSTLPTQRTPVPASDGGTERIAAGQFERARQVIAEGHYAYGIPLLLNCCKLVPGNLDYRRALRRANQERQGGRSRAAWLAWLLALPRWLRVQAALRRDNPALVLEEGERVLAIAPRHIAVQLDMMEAAEQLDLPRLAVWILRQARKQAPLDSTLGKALARLYVRQRSYTEAIAVWTEVLKAHPDDPEAAREIRDLAAHETLQQGGYERSS